MDIAYMGFDLGSLNAGLLKRPRNRSRRSMSPLDLEPGNDSVRTIWAQLVYISDTVWDTLHVMCHEP